MPLLAKHAIDVWQARMDDLPLPEHQLTALLAPDEHVRALRRKRPQDRKMAIAARGLLRVLLGRSLGIAPQSVRFVYGKFGKPALPPAQNPAGLSFNVSHCEDMVLFAVTQGAALGVDVERNVPNWPMEEVAPLLFSEQRLAEWGKLPAAERDEWFWRAWVRREACGKASGVGIAHAAPWPQEESGYHVEDLPLGGDYCGAVAYGGPPRPVRLRVWNEAAL